MTELVVIWDGSHQDSDRDLLCVQLPGRSLTAQRLPARHPSEPETCHERTQRIREQLIDLLRERPVWTTQEVRERLQADRLILGGIIQRAKAVGTIRSVSYGVIALAQRDEAAA